MSLVYSSVNALRHGPAFLPGFLEVLSMNAYHIVQKFFLVIAFSFVSSSLLCMELKRPKAEGPKKAEAPKQVTGGFQRAGGFRTLAIAVSDDMKSASKDRNSARSGSAMNFEAMFKNRTSGDTEDYRDFDLTSYDSDDDDTRKSRSLAADASDDEDGKSATTSAQAKLFQAVASVEDKDAQFNLEFFVNAVKASQFTKPEYFDYGRMNDSKYAEAVNGIFNEKILKHEAFQKMYEAFGRQLETFVATMKTVLDDDKIWVGNKKPSADVYDLTKGGFWTYVQKINIPKGSRVYTWGDLHGGFHSLVNMLVELYNNGIIDKTLKVIKPNTYFKFLGDFVDRGFCGIETIFLLLIFKNRNPDVVFLVRGNHEEIGINHDYGFIYEAGLKIKQEVIQLLAGFYNLLPVASFVNNQMLCCHGGLDFCYNTSKLFETKQPLACELITHENYEPRRLLASISGDCLRDVCSEMVDASLFELAQDIHGSVQNLKQVEDKIISCFNTTKQWPGDIKALAKPFEFPEGFIAGQQKIAEEIENKKALCYSYFLVVQQSFIVLEQSRSTEKLDEKVYATNMKHFKTSSENYVENLQKIQNLVIQYVKNISDLATQNTLAGPVSIADQDIKELDSRFDQYDAHTEQMKSIEETKDQLVQFLIPAVKTIDASTKVIQQLGNKFPKLFGPDGIFTLFVQQYDEKLPDVLYAFGFAWNDSNTSSDGQPILMRSHMRYCIGQKLAHEIMKYLGFYAVMRAHQHTGSMAERLIKDGGVVALWGGEQGRILPIKKGSVYTLQVAHASGMRLETDVPTDIFTCLHINDDALETWTLEKITVRYTDKPELKPIRVVTPTTVAKEGPARFGAISPAVKSQSPISFGTPGSLSAFGSVRPIGTGTSAFGKPLLVPAKKAVEQPKVVGQLKAVSADSAASV